MQKRCNVARCKKETKRSLTHPTQGVRLALSPLTISGEAVYFLPYNCKGPYSKILARRAQETP